MGLKKCYVTHWVELSKPDKNSEVFSNMESGNISIAYNDEDLNVEWPLKFEPILSEKDKKQKSFKEVIKLL